MPDRHLKERTKEKKEAMVANFSFYNGYFGDNFWPTDGRRPFGGNLSKNRARYLNGSPSLWKLACSGLGKASDPSSWGKFCLHKRDSRTNKCLFWICPSLSAHLKPYSIDNRVTVRLFLKHL